jgi:hypothetical protein
VVAMVMGTRMSPRIRMRMMMMMMIVVMMTMTMMMKEKKNRKKEKGQCGRVPTHGYRRQVRRDLVAPEVHGPPERETP